MKYHLERGQYSEKMCKVYLVLFFLNEVLPYELFANVVMHGMAQVLAENPQDRQEILEVLKKQTEYYEEVLRRLHGGGGSGERS